MKKQFYWSNNVIGKLEFFALLLLSWHCGFCWARLSTDCFLAARFGDISLWGFQLQNQKEYFVLRKSDVWERKQVWSSLSHVPYQIRLDAWCWGRSVLEDLESAILNTILKYVFSCSVKLVIQWSVGSTSQTFYYNIQRHLFPCLLTPLAFSVTSFAVASKSTGGDTNQEYEGTTFGGKRWSSAIVSVDFSAFACTAKSARSDCCWTFMISVTPIWLGTLEQTDPIISSTKPLTNKSAAFSMPGTK